MPASPPGPANEAPPAALVARAPAGRVRARSAHRELAVKATARPRRLSVTRPDALLWAAEALEREDGWLVWLLARDGDQRPRQTAYDIRLQLCRLADQLRVKETVR